MASVTATVVAWIRAERVTRLQSKASLQLERLRVEEAKRERAFTVAREESEPLAAALTAAWNDVQVLKDVAARTLSATRLDASVGEELVQTASGKSTVPVVFPVPGLATPQTIQSRTTWRDGVRKTRSSGQTTTSQAPAPSARWLKSRRHCSVSRHIRAVDCGGARSGGLGGTWRDVG
ncbi:hypothetical protein rosag_14890 [Roseisolibacter agri]|uniref:Uncharacterized protein n=1 Tax=Roseisolibacter agri TaxID=2014610 RepID=A0AA37Q8H5_9BACT|nr:hypothetical protein rosag_14890 [Roseisolibacter agri]